MPPPGAREQAILPRAAAPGAHQGWMW